MNTDALQQDLTKALESVLKEPVILTVQTEGRGIKIEFKIGESWSGGGILPSSSRVNWYTWIKDRLKSYVDYRTQQAFGTIELAYHRRELTIEYVLNDMEMLGFDVINVTALNGEVILFTVKPFDFPLPGYLVEIQKP